MARIVFVGDLMLGRLVSEQLRAGRRPKSCWGDLLPLLEGADGVIANLECAITRHDQPWLRTPKVFHFGADPCAIDVLRAGNVRAVSLANNHTLDFEVAGLLDTLDHLDRAGIAHAGAGRNEEAAFAPARLTLGDLEVALFAVTDNEPDFAAGGGSPGTAYVDLTLPTSAMRPSADAVAAARRDGVDLIVLSCHLGPNMVTAPSPDIRAFRRIAAANGIDVIHGHSAHVTQGIECIGNTLVMHDAGDFLDDYAIDPALHNDWSFLFTLEADREGARHLTLTPVILGFADVRRANREEADAICSRMVGLSADLGATLIRTAEGLECAWS